MLTKIVVIQNRIIGYLIQQNGCPAWKLIINDLIQYFSLYHSTLPTIGLIWRLLAYFALMPLCVMKNTLYCLFTGVCFTSHLPRQMLFFCIFLFSNHLSHGLLLNLVNWFICVIDLIRFSQTDYWFQLNPKGGGGKWEVRVRDGGSIK